MESDEGTFTPLGLEYSGGEAGACVLTEILKCVQHTYVITFNVIRFYF